MKVKSKTFIIIVMMISLVSMSVTGSAESTEGTPTDTDGTATPAASDETVAATAPTASGADLSKMEIVAQNDSLILYIHPETTEIAVKDKKNGTIWYSNPANRDQEKNASPFNKARLGSQLTITYYNSAGQTKQFDNYNDSIKNKQFEVSKIDNGVKIVYMLGDMSLGIDAVPMRISKKRLDTMILDKISDEKVRKDVLKRFKLLKEENVYERRDAALTDVALKRLLKVFEEVGYTEEELAIDNQENSTAGGGVDEKASFTIPIEYRIDGDNLLATIPAKEIKQPESFPLTAISFLENFGAADQSKKGYMLVPDGSGALIYLNNGKTQHDPYLTSVYGTDNASFMKEKIQEDEPARLPIFGMKQGDEAFIGMIEHGDAIANVEADISGRINSYNRVYTSYATIAKDEITLTGGYKSNTITVFQAEPFYGNITVRYGFLKGDAANYAGMAQYYQSYLVDKYNLSPLEKDDHLPFILELIGSIEKRKSFLGIPYQAQQPLTTFNQAKTIVNELLDHDINNIKLRYVGWFNEGVNHKIPTNVSPDSELGGKKQFEDLVDYLKNKDIDFYPDVAFLQVYKDTWGFSPSKDASRFINRKPVKVFRFSPASFQQDRIVKPSYVLSPTVLPEYVGKFIDSYKPYDIPSISLRDFGNEMNSDYREDNVVNRQESKQILDDQLKKLHDDFGDMLVAGGNSNTLPYAKTVIDAPLSSNQYNITDENVPFYEMVLHGYYDYAGMPMNVADDQNMRQNVLKALETGSNVYFQWFYAPSSAVKDTSFDDKYSSHYKDWLTQAKSMYDEVDAVLKDVRDQRISAHEKLAEGVSRTTFEQGTTIVVNYNNESVNVDGVTVEAQSYIVGGEKR